MYLHSEELCLYTLTRNSVLRIFTPVIDAPSRLQLHGSLDRWAFLSGGVDDDDDDDDDVPSESDTLMPIFPLNRDVLCKSLPPDNAGSEVDQGRRRKLQELIEEDWELFAFIAKDGSLIVRVLTVG